MIHKIPCLPFWAFQLLCLPLPLNLNMPTPPWLTGVKSLGKLLAYWMISSWKTQSHGNMRLRAIREPITNLSIAILLPFKMRNLRDETAEWGLLAPSPVFFPLNHLKKNASKIEKVGLPWWRSGWESSCQCRGHGFEPWSRRIPHAAEQLGPWAATTEHARLEPVLRNKRGRDSERPAHHDEEWPPLATTRESPRTETKTQHSHK